MCIRDRDKVTGTVVAITPTEIQVDLGTKHAGYIPVSELTDDPTAKVEELVKVGDEIETFVVRVNDQEGVVTLSKKRLDVVKGWEEIEAARENETVLDLSLIHILCIRDSRETFWFSISTSVIFTSTLSPSASTSPGFSMR